MQVLLGLRGSDVNGGHAVRLPGYSWSVCVLVQCMELHYAKLQEERVSAGHSPQSRRKSENTTGETHTRLRSAQRRYLSHELIADCL